MELEATKPNRAQTAAKASWLGPLAIVCLNVVALMAFASQGQRLIAAGASLFLALASFAGAIYALVSIRKYGRSGVLIPAVIGLVLSSLILAAYINAILLGLSLR